MAEPEKSPAVDGVAAMLQAAANAEVGKNDDDTEEEDGEIAEDPKQQEAPKQDEEKPVDDNDDDDETEEEEEGEIVSTEEARPSAMDISPVKQELNEEETVEEAPAKAAEEGEVMEESSLEKEEDLAKEESTPEETPESPAEKAATTAESAESPVGDATKPEEGEVAEGEVAEEEQDQTQSEVTAYSTRGRSEPEAASAPATTSAAAELAAPPAAAGAPPSFLSDSLTEEERRTRTRYIPVVPGMHMLRKHEIKGDLVLARTGKPKRTKRQEAGSGEEDEKSPAPSEDERLLAQGGKSIALGTANLILPCGGIFVPPEPPSTKPSPRHVEAVTAFNPPRPPESVGAKKKHRLLRWERRPADMEVDLHNYRKTVQRTQDELRATQRERDRLLTAENMQRAHLMQHYHNLHRELKCLNAEWNASLQDCVSVVPDHLTTRTRSRGPGQVMRDVLSALRARQGGGAKEQLKAEWEPVRGMGGVGDLCFQDWNHDTVFEPKTIASAWIVPGDKVQTPSGEEGEVLALPVYGDEETKEESGDAMDIDSPAKEGAKTEGKPAEKQAADRAPKVAVKLQSGVKHFLPSELKTKEDPRTYSDEHLAQRWKALFETAKAVAPALDLEAMATEDKTMDLEKRRLLPFGAELMPTANGRGKLILDEQKKVDEWDEALDKPLYDGFGVTGFKGNRSVPQQLSAVEALRDEKLLLQARALQLRNKVYRQRRIRLLNERTLSATKERAIRVEALVAEMRADLKSLKNRLDQEIKELGVTEKEAETILADYFRSLESQEDVEGVDEEEEDEESDEPAPKRQRQDSESEEGEIEESDVPLQPAVGVTDMV